MIRDGNSSSAAGSLNPTGAMEAAGAIGFVGAMGFAETIAFGGASGPTSDRSSEAL
jgi:hypothetical protein